MEKSWTRVWTRICFIAIFVPLSIFLFFSHVVAEPGYDIIIQTGQSNQVGGGKGPFSYPVDCDFTRIFQVGRFGADNMEIIPVTGEDLQHWTFPHGTGHGVAFACLYAEELLEEDRKIIIIPAAKGNTSITFWQPNLNGEGIRDIIARTRLALKQPGENKVVAVLWQQGERDVVLGVSKETYKARLERLVKALRKRFGERLPFLVGRPVFTWRYNDPERREIDDAQLAVAIEFERVAIVPSDNLNSNERAGTGEDVVHFSAQAQMDLAENYFREFKRMLKAK